jgi:hypothetical protein
MQEFWFCEACKSMNRGDAANCYKCRAPRAQATMATVHERRLADITMPGVDELTPDHARALLARYPYSAAWPIGYASIALLAPPVLFQLGFLLCEVAYLIALVAPNSYSLGAGWSLLVAICAGGYGLSILVAAVVHSVFLALTDANVPSLGGGQPRFAPPRAAAWWIESALWAWRANATVWIPLYIGIVSMSVVGLFGIVFAMALIWLATKYLRNPMYSLRKPARLLEDMVGRLSLRGSNDTGLPGLWSAAWSTARMIDVISPVVVIGGGFIIVVAQIIQMMREASGSAPASELTFIGSLTTMSAVLVLLLMAEVAANTIALVLLARVTWSLSDSEKVRRKWVVQSAGWPSGPFPNGYPAAAFAPAAAAAPATAFAPATGPAAPTYPVPPAPMRVVTFPSPPPISAATFSAPPQNPERAVTEPPAPLSQPPVSAPTPAAQQARWIRAQAEFAGVDSSPLPPDEPPSSTEPAPVLRPSSSKLTRYGSPQPTVPAPALPEPAAPTDPASGPPSAEAPDQPSAPAAPVEPPAPAVPAQPATPAPAASPAAAEPAAFGADPADVDWPEGI